MGSSSRTGSSRARRAPEPAAVRVLAEAKQLVLPVLRRWVLAETIMSRKNIDILLGCALLLLVMNSVFLSLQIDHIPRTSWTGAVFWNEPITFYVGQLVEYSFIYLFAFASFFIVRKRKFTEISLLRYGALVTLVFFTLWKSFQCRYILFAIPLLVILAFELIFVIYERISEFKSFIPRVVVKGLLVLLIFYGVSKTYLIDLSLSFTNDMCYF